MIEHPTDAESGVPVTGICSHCEEELEEGDRIFRLNELAVTFGDDGYYSTRPIYDATEGRMTPQVHKGCLEELLDE